MQGDQESKRAKFVVVQYNGPSLGGMAKSRCGVHRPGSEREREGEGEGEPGREGGKPGTV